MSEVSVDISGARHIGDDVYFHDHAIGVLYTIRKLAHLRGYAVAVHGSLAKDMDLVAIPWTDKACSAEELVAAVIEATRASDLPQCKNPGIKPHGRKVWTLNLLGFGMYIDFGVMPLGTSTPVAPEAGANG